MEIQEPKIIIQRKAKRDQLSKLCRKENLEMKKDGANFACNAIMFSSKSSQVPSEICEII